MARRGEMKRQIANMFVSLVETLPLEKVSVTLLVDQLGINRKTFYYHFNDKNDLIIWNFRDDLERALKSTFSADHLIVPGPLSGDRYPLMPYYSRTITKGGDLDQTRFFQLLVKVLRSRRDYYLKVLDVSNAVFRRYLVGLYEFALESDIRFMLGQRYMAPDTMEYLATYYTVAFLNMSYILLEHSEHSHLGRWASPFGNLTHEGMKHAIEDHSSFKVDGKGSMGEKGA